MAKAKGRETLNPLFQEKTLTFQFLSPHSTELVVCGLYRMLFSRIVKAEAIIQVFCKLNLSVDSFQGCSNVSNAMAVCTPTIPSWAPLSHHCGDVAGRCHAARIQYQHWWTSSPTWAADQRLLQSRLHK